MRRAVLRKCRFSNAAARVGIARATHGPLFLSALSADVGETLLLVDEKNKNIIPNKKIVSPILFIDFTHDNVICISHGLINICMQSLYSYI